MQSTIESIKAQSTTLDNLRPHLCDDCLFAAGGIALGLVVPDEEIPEDCLTDEDDAHILAVLRQRLCARCADQLRRIESGVMDETPPLGDPIDKNAVFALARSIKPEELFNGMEVADYLPFPEAYRFDPEAGCRRCRTHPDGRYCKRHEGCVVCMWCGRGRLSDVLIAHEDGTPPPPCATCGVAFVDLVARFERDRASRRKRVEQSIMEYVQRVLDTCSFRIAQQQDFEIDIHELIADLGMKPTRIVIERLSALILSAISEIENGPVDQFEVPTSDDVFKVALFEPRTKQAPEAGR